MRSGGGRSCATRWSRYEGPSSGIGRRGRRAARRRCGVAGRGRLLVPRVAPMSRWSACAASGSWPGARPRQDRRSARRPRSPQRRPRGRVPCTTRSSRSPRRRSATSATVGGNLFARRRTATWRSALLALVRAGRRSSTQAAPATSGCSRRPARHRGLLRCPRALVLHEGDAPQQNSASIVTVASDGQRGSRWAARRAGRSARRGRGGARRGRHRPKARRAPRRGRRPVRRRLRQRLVSPPRPARPRPPSASIHMPSSGHRTGPSTAPRRSSSPSPAPRCWARCATRSA